MFAPEKLKEHISETMERVFIVVGNMMYIYLSKLK
jgi:hypothetical protein